ncbi:MAG: hypothetical protein IKB93_10460 [Clostridia bacterium]|nr:hypothetical protein [Clostridia bacterium]
MQDIIEKLKAMDKRELDAMVKKAKNFVATPEGQALAQKIKNGEGLSEIGLGAEQQNNIKKELSQNPSIAKTIFDILNGKG